MTETNEGDTRPEGGAVRTSRNYLADDIRQINDWQGIPEDLRRFVTRLADRVEQLGDQPVDASTELEPEQKIRAGALDSAARLLAPVLAESTLSTVDINLERIGEMWLELAARGAELIRDGSQPGGGLR